MYRKFYAKKSDNNNMKVASNENFMTETFSNPVMNYFRLAIFSQT